MNSLSIAAFRLLALGVIILCAPGSDSSEGGLAWAQGELQRMVEQAQRLGIDRHVNALLSEALGLGAVRHPIKYLSALEETREFAVSRAEELNPLPVIMSRFMPDGAEAYYYLASPEGDLRVAVHAIKGKGFFRVKITEALKEDFARQKQFWLFEYRPK